MKKITLFIAVLIPVLTFSQTTVYTENFEGAVNYTVSTPEFSDGGSDFFKKIDVNSPGISGSYAVTGQEGDNFFAANDLDGEGASHTQTLIINDINIEGATNMELVFSLAEDDDSSKQDWDADTFFTIEFDIDNTGSFTKIFQVSSQGATNTEPGVDTNFDGIGNGTKISSAFQDFTETISGVGSLMDLKLTFVKFDAGDEDIAIDNIRLNSATALSLRNKSIPGLIATSDNGAISINKGEILAIYNVVGAEVSNENLTSGIYMVHVIEGANSEIKKVLVK